MSADDTSTLIALLEWERDAALAREAEWRRRVARLVDRQGITALKHAPDRLAYTSSARAWVRTRDLASLAELLLEPADDRRLRQRLESARWEAGAWR